MLLTTACLWYRAFHNGLHLVPELGSHMGVPLTKVPYGHRNASVIVLSISGNIYMYFTINQPGQTVFHQTLDHKKYTCSLARSDREKKMREFRFPNERRTNCSRRTSLRIEMESPLAGKVSLDLLTMRYHMVPRPQKALRARIRPTPEKIVNSWSWSTSGIACRNEETLPKEKNEA